MLQSAPKFFFTERQIIIPQTKSFLTTLRLLAILRIKKPFFSKKCIFWPENDVFSKNLFYSKLIRDQNYIMCTCQKIHFQNKIMRLQFSPDYTYTYSERSEEESSLPFSSIVKGFADSNLQMSSFQPRNHTHVWNITLFKQGRKQ